MTTDFYVTAAVLNLSDQVALAQIIMGVYAVLSDLPEDQLPARQGYLDFAFASGGQTKRLRAAFDTFATVIESGNAGAALINALVGLR
jgi:hypothetical protein